MTFTLPTVNNNHQGDPNSNARYLAEINTLVVVAAKSMGNLPIADSAGQFRNEQAFGSVGGIGYEFQASQATWDVSSQTKVLLWHNQMNAPNRQQVGTVAQGGCRIRIYSGTGTMPTNYKEYYLGGSDTPNCASVSGQYPYIIDLNDTSHDAGSGFSNTLVSSYAFLSRTEDQSGLGETNWCYMGTAYVIDTIKTSADTPTFKGTSSFGDAVTLLQGSDYTDKLGSWIRQIGDVIFMDMPFRIGDNSTETDFNDNGKTIVSPVHNDSSDPRVRVTTQAFRTYLNLRDNVADTAIFSGTWIWGTRAAFDWDQSDNAVVTFSSPTFTGMGDFTIGSSVSGPAIFNSVGVVTMDSSSDLDGSSFKTPYGDHLLSIG